jgi:hypothetical protein
MKKIIFITFSLAFVFIACAAPGPSGTNQKNANSELSAEQQRMLELMIENRMFVFNATDMFPRGEAGMQLNYDCDVQLKDSTMISYLPFIGKSYNLTPNQPHSGFDFTREIEDYTFKRKRKGYEVKVDVKNGSDYLKYSFYITETGSSTLTVSSNQRQSISYYGTINTVK